jgi:hypothetical protein
MSKAREMKFNFILAALLLIGATQEETAFKLIDKEISESRHPQSLTSDDLYGFYDHNAIRADRQFKNNIVVVTGKIAKISRHPTNGLAVVTFAPTERTQYNLNCYFSKNHERDAAALYKGKQAVDLVGKVAGAKSLEIIILGCRAWPLK